MSEADRSLMKHLCLSTIRPNIRFFHYLIHIEHVHCGAGSIGIDMRMINHFSHMRASVRFVLRLLFSDEVTMSEDRL